MRLLLTEHHPQHLSSLSSLLNSLQGIDLVGEAVDGGSLLELAADCAPDLVLLDDELSGIPIERLVGCLHANHPRPVVIVMSSHVEYTQTAFKAGADAFISKDEQPGWLLQNLCRYCELTRPLEPRKIAAARKVRIREYSKTRNQT